MRHQGINWINADYSLIETLGKNLNLDDVIHVSSEKYRLFSTGLDYLTLLIMKLESSGRTR